jgi:hypothetical protein
MQDQEEREWVLRNEADLSIARERKTRFFRRYPRGEKDRLSQSSCSVVRFSDRD